MPRFRITSRVLVALVMLAGALALSASPVSASHVATSPEAACLDTQEAEFLRLINEYRATHGLPALQATKSLNVASFSHSRDMAERSYFSHSTHAPLPADQSGAQPWDRMRDAGYRYPTYMGENIAAGYQTAAHVFEGWRNSPGHNRNMLSPHFRAIGIGLVIDGSSPYGYYWTTDFGGVVDTLPTCG